MEAPAARVVSLFPNLDPDELVGFGDAPSRFSLAKAWTPALAETRYVGVVRGFLENYSTLRPSLTPGEALFVIHLMAFKWGEDAPYPSYKRIAAMMGVSDKMARRHAQALEIKGYLVRPARMSRTNEFDLTPLFRALEKKIFGEVRTNA